MVQCFETDVYPVVVKWAKKTFPKDDEKFSITLVLGWYLWNQCQEKGKEFAPSHIARIAVYHVFQRRDLPGVRTGKTQDVWEKGTRLPFIWNAVWDMEDIWERMAHFAGGSMSQVQDKRPGPAKLVESKDHFAHWYAGLTGRQKELVDLYLSGITATQDLAEHMRCTPGNVSQIRRLIAEDWREC